MTTTIADSTLGVGSQARAVLAYLEREPGFAAYANGRYDIEIETRAWYNGRERGISLTVYRCGYDGHLIITFGECRNSDSIFVDCWIQKRNPFPTAPTTEDFTDEAYENRKSFNEGAAGRAADYIYSKMRHFYRNMRKTEPKEQEAI